MSQQILRNPANRSVYNIPNKFEKNNLNSTMTLTKIKNPLNNKLSTNQEKRFSVTDKILNNQVEMNEQFQHFSKKQNMNKNNHQYLVKKQSLQQPQYRFYADRFNLSSDDSFMLDQSMRESRKQKLENQISQKFKNSRKQIQELLRRSRERRGERSEQSVSQIQNKKLLTENDRNKKIDKKQAKRKRLNYYHCDSIIIKPQFHPIKVFQLAIKPTTHCIKNDINHLQPNFEQNNFRQIQADQSFSSNSKYESVKKSTTTKNHKFLDSFNQSPLDKLNDSKHDCDVDSPSFLLQRKQRSRSNFEQMSFFKDKSVQKKKKIFLQKDNLLKNTNDQSLNFNYKRSRAVSEHQGKSNNFDKDSQQTVPTHSFKKRNKIFANDKKSGLKLSRAIRYQEQINKLKGQMGVDVFHIVIQQEEFLRQCCT